MDSDIADTLLTYLIIYFFTTILLLLVLGATGKYCDGRDKQNKASRGEAHVKNSHGLYASAMWPGWLRGPISLVITLVAMTPSAIIVICSILGGVLALVEGWPLREGVLYLLGNVLGLSNALTDFSPESNTGKILDVIVSTWALLMTGTVMGIIAGLSLVTDLTENMPSSVWGFLRYVLIYIPLVVVISSFAAGGLIAAVEGWTLDVGFYFMVSSICGLSQPLVDQEPEGAAGILVEVLAICIELGFAGAIIGIIGAHPLVADLITKIEGDHVDKRFANLVDEVEELADSHGSQIKEGGQFRQKSLTLSKILRIQGCLPAEPTVEEIKNVFAMLDKDGKGSLDIYEVKEAFASLGVSGDDVGSIFKDIDANGDGHIALDKLLIRINERADPLMWIQ